MTQRITPRQTTSLGGDGVDDPRGILFASNAGDGTLTVDDDVHREWVGRLVLLDERLIRPSS